jgi:CheY-like chemotaxis protein
MDFQSGLFDDEPIKILVVDDDEDNLFLMHYQLQQLFPCAIISAADGQTALTLAATMQPEIILLDIMLPELDGFEVARRLKQNPQTQLIPIIAVTAMARIQDQELAIAAGYDAYLCKPYEMDQLAITIHQHLKRVCQIWS